MIYFKIRIILVDLARGSSVGIATRHGLDGLGIESLLGEVFLACPDPP